MSANPAVQEHRTFRFAERMSRIKSSAVREILKVTERPGIISFAGGLPAPELFPVEAIAEAHARVFATDGQAALQYSTTEGFIPLRKWICERMATRGIEASPENVLVTSGSQQGIDLIAKVFLGAGDRVVVENPSYLAALQAFTGYEATLIPVGSDDAGMRVDELEKILTRENPKFIYIVPEFQNPKGTSLSLERRSRMIEIARRHSVPIVEDDPYGELRFQGKIRPPLASLDRNLVVYLSTFSKTLSPGIRIGWAVGDEEIIRAMTVAKQASDLHTSTLEQRAIAKLLETFDYDDHIDQIRQVYSERQEAMITSLVRYFTGNAKWTHPEGGLFLWLQLPPWIRGDELLNDVLERGVAFVPGAPFFVKQPRHNFIRLNFSNRPPEVIDDGMRRISEALSLRMQLGPQAQVKHPVLASDEN